MAIVAALVAGLSVAASAPGEALGAGSRIAWAGGSWYLQGTNYPWHNYGTDFGSNAWGVSGVHTAASYAAVDSDFAKMAAEGVHSVRWWVFSDGRAGITFDNAGIPTGIDANVFPDLDAAVQIAANHNIYLDLVLLDFTFMENATTSSGVQLGGHANVINTAAGQQALINNVFIPVFKRYGTNPMIVSWEVMNEPEWAITEDGAVNSSVSQPSSLANFQAFTSAVATAVHANTKSYVTVGEAAMKWDQQWKGLGLDFYEIHYYDWMNPFANTNLYGATAASLGLDAPVVVGEFPAANSTTANLQQYLNTWFSNGYAGAWSWSYAGVDSNGVPSPTVMQPWATAHAAAIVVTPNAGVPTYDHIFTILMENHSYSEVIGAPYISTLAHQGAAGGQYFATDHPSLPNYAELTSGQSFPNASSDCSPSSSCQSTARNLVDTLTAGGLSWHAYEESMGSPCQYSNVGQYAVRHDPFTYYTDISNATCVANVVDYSNLSNDLKLPSTLANYVFITPNVCNDMHDCSIATGDTWLSSNVPAILGSGAFTSQRSLLVVVWDEDDFSQSNQVAWIAVGYGVKTNYVSSVSYNHYSYLRTVEASWGLPTLTTNDGSASVMSDMFGSSTPPPPLVASAGASPTSGVAPLTVNFTGSASGGTAPYMYAWNFGDNTTSSSQNPSHAYTVAGTYTAQLTVTDGAGRTATSSASAVTVNLAPLTATASARPPAGDSPLTVAFTGTAVGGMAPYTYAWTFGDGTSGTGPTPSHTFSAAGTYSVTLTVTDATNQKTTAPATVTVSPTLGLSVGASPQTLDASDSVAFTSTPTGGLGPFSYSWSFGDGATSTSAAPSHAYAAAGSYSATLTVTDANLATVSASVGVTVHALPAVNAAAAPNAGDAPVTVQLTATPSGGTQPYSYSWNFGDGSAASATQSPSHTYSAAGTYTATVTLTDGLGHSATSTATVAVASPVSATAGSSPTTGPAPLAVSLTSTPSGGKAPYMYSWNFGDGTAAGTIQNPGHTYASAGTYTATVTVTDANGSSVSATAPTITVTLVPLKVTAGASALAGDAPLAVTFSATGTGGAAPLAYAWTFGDGATGAGNGPSHTYTAAGTFTATVTVTDASAQTATASVVVVVSPALTLSVAANPQSVDVGDAVSLTSTPGGGLAPYTYSWSFGDGATSTTANPSHAFASAGSFSANLTITDANGDKVSASVAITVRALPTVSATASPSSGDAPVAVAFTSAPAGGTQPYMFSWTFGDGSALSAAQNPTHTYGVAGSYTATVTLTDGAGHAVTASVPVSVSPALSATAGASPTSGAAPLTVSLSATPSGGRAPFTYSWNFGDGSAASTTQNPSHTYSSAGTFSAKVTVTDANGAISTATTPSVTVTPTPLVVGASGAPAAGDAPVTVAFKSTATGGTAPLSFAWNFGDNTTGTGATVDHTYSAAGSFTATLTVTDAGNQSATATVTIVVSPALGLTIAASPQAVDAGDSVTFTSSPSGGLAPYAYSWTFGDGATSSAANPTHAYAAAGSFTAMLTVTDVNGVRASFTIAVSVRALPTVAAVASPTAGDAPVTVQLTATAGGGTSPVAYSWDFGDGSVPSAVQNPSHLYGAAGAYTATVTVTDALGHIAKATASVTVSPALSAGAGATPTSGQAPLTVSMTSTPTGGKSPYTYSWSFGDGSAAGTTQNPTHTYASAGTFTATVTVTDSFGKTATAGAPAVTVAPAPLVAYASASPLTGDAPLTTTLNGYAVGGTGPFTYTWDLGDGTTSYMQIVAHSYGVGTYTATLTIADSAGKSSSATAHVTVFPALTVTSQVSPNQGTSPLQVGFSALASGGLAPFHYAWNFGDGTTGTGATATHSYSAGAFTAKLTVTDAAGGTWIGGVADITVAAPPAPAGGSAGPGGSSSGGGANPPPAGAGATTPNPATPSAEASPSAAPSPTESPGGTSAPRAPDSGNGGVPLLVIAGLFTPAVGGLLFLAWRRFRVS